MNEITTIEDLKFDPENARKRSTRSKQMIADSLTDVGLARSIVISEDGTILAGNGTVEGAASLGKTRVQVVDADGDTVIAVRRSGLTDEQKKRLAYYDNRSSDLSTFDSKQIQQDLLAGVDLSKMWNETEIAKLMASVTEEPSAEDTDAADAMPDGNTIEQRCEDGQIWKLDDHYLYCGDCKNLDALATMIGDRRINLAVTSPPYASQRKYDEESEFTPIPPDAYVEWWEGVQAGVQQYLADDGSFFLNIKPSSDGLDTSLYVFDLVIAMVRQWGWHFATEFCWERVGMPKHVKQRFRNQFEPVYQFTRNRWKMRPEAVMHKSSAVRVPRGEGAGATTWGDDMHNRDRFVAQEVVEGMAYPGNRLPTFQMGETNHGHSAVFPVGLPEFFIKAYTDVGDLVYDPFAGSGTTLIAAEKNQRVFVGCEISPKYCEIIIQRWINYTGHEAVCL